MKIDNNLILTLISALRDNEHQSIAQILNVKERLEVERLEDELTATGVFKVNPNWKGGNSTVDGFKWLIPTELGRKIESKLTTYEEIIENNKKDKAKISKTINQNFNFLGDNYGNVSQPSESNIETIKSDTLVDKTPKITPDNKSGGIFKKLAIAVITSLIFPLIVAFICYKMGWI